MANPCIDFGFNNRIKELVNMPDKDEAYALLEALLADLIKEFDPVKTPRPERDWNVVRGPGLYALINSYSCGPRIVWIGEAEHVKGRITEHLRLGKLIFDGVRSVFIESDPIKLCLEKRLIEYFAHDPESCHDLFMRNKHHTR